MGFVYIFEFAIAALGSFESIFVRKTFELLKYVIRRTILQENMTIFHKKRLLLLTAFRKKGYKKILTHS